jgi:hypothetical protein
VSSAASHSSHSLIEIASHVEVIDTDDFKGNEEVIEFVFASGSHLREIRGFRGCTSLCRIEFPSSIEVTTSNSFNGCRSLSELLFASDSHLRQIGGFCECTSLCRIEFPSSVEVIGSFSFRGCTSLRVVRFPHGSKISVNKACKEWKTFIQFEAEREQVKRKRDCVHLQCSWPW